MKTYAAIAVIAGSMGLFISSSAVSAGSVPHNIGVETRIDQIAGQRVKLNGQEVAAAYVGKTVSSRQHSTTYKPDGTWVNKSGQKGRYKISNKGILSMTGDINIRLEVFREGNRYYNRNVQSGAGGYYTAN